MGLGKSIKRLLPAALAAGLGLGSIWYGQSVKPSQKPEVRKQAREKLNTWLLTGTGTTLATLLAAYGIRRLKGKKEALLQSAVENPYTAGAVTAISYGTTAYAQIYDPLFSSVCGLVPAAGVFTMSRALRLVNPPYWKNYPSIVRDSLIVHFSSDDEKKEKSLKRMRLYAADPNQVDITLVDFLFKHRKIDEGLEYLNTAVKASQTPQHDTVLEQHFVNPIAHEIVIGMRSKHNFLRFYSHFRMGEVDEAIQALDDFVDDKSPSKSAARSYVLQHLSRHEPQLKSNLEKHVSRAWQDTIQKVLADPEREKKFTLMGESRNEVLEYEANEFLKGLLVFKRCDIEDRDRLIRERENILALRKRFGNQIIQSLAYVEHEGKAYHVLRHESGKNLDNLLKGARGFEISIGVWTDAGQLLAGLHKADMPWESPEIAEDYYSDRLVKVCYDNLAASPNIKVSDELRAELEKSGRNVYDGLKDAPLGWYKDANWRNWLGTEQPPMGKRSAIAIDFEHCIRLPIQLDLVSLLESAYANEYEQNLVRETYLVSFGKPKDRKKFNEEYKWAGLQRHLELAGYRTRDKEYDAVRFHITEARSYALEVNELALATLLGKKEHISITS